jgi:hypothetical protein
MNFLQPTLVVRNTVEPISVFGIQLGSSVQLIQGDKKVSVNLMITIQKVTSKVQSVPRQSPDIY